MQKVATRYRRGYTAAGPVEDTHSNLMFELTNTATQGRLLNEQKFCSPAKSCLRPQPRWRTVNEGRWIAVVQLWWFSD